MDSDDATDISSAAMATVSDKVVPSTLESPAPSKADGPPATARAYAEEVNSMSALRALTVWSALALATFCIFLDEGIIATAVPRITDEFQSLGDVGWYGSAYNLTLCSLQLVFGRLYTNYPIKVVFLLSLLVFEVGSLICATSPSSAVLIVGRAIAGSGAAGLTAGSLVLTSAVLPAKKLPLYIGALGIVYGVAAVIGPVVGGVITDSYLTWRWCFYINLPLAALPLAATLFLIKAPPRDETQKLTILQKLRDLDPLGMLLLLPGIISFILALQFGGSLYAWNDGRTIACFIVAGVLIIAFLVEQWKLGEKALIPPRFFKIRVVVFGSIFAFCLDSAFYTLVYFLPLWFQAILNVSPADSAVHYLAFVIPFVFAIFGSGWAVSKIGYYQPFQLAGTILVSAGAGLLSTLHPSSGASQWIPYQLLAGLGVGLSTQQAAVAVQSSLDSADVAIGVALVLFFQCFGPTVFITAAQAVFESALTRGIGNRLPSIDPDAVKTAGATQLRDLVSGDDVDTLLEVYNYALSRAYLVAAGLAAASIIGVVGMGLKKIQTEEPPKDEEVAEKPLSADKLPTEIIPAKSSIESLIEGSQVSEE